jgi:hypothetical protein
MYTTQIKLDSDVDVRCDACDRIGRQGYLLSSARGGVVDNVNFLCPDCYEFLLGDFIDDNGWRQKGYFGRTTTPLCCTRRWEGSNEVMKVIMKD